MDSVAELRIKIEKQLEEYAPSGTIHPKDIERIHNDAYLERVLKSCKNDVTNATKLLWSILKWRTSVGASDVNEDNIRMDYVNSGVFFPYGRDKDGCKMLVFICQKYSRSQFEIEEVKKVIIYWLDRIEREQHGSKVTLFFDVENSSLSNFDIDLVRYLIECFYRYPNFLAKIVVYQLPWLLTATFRLVKKLLPPEAVEIMRLASKQNVLEEVVNPDQALTRWGGKVDFEFKFTPEKKKRVSFATTTDRQQSITNMVTEDVQNQNDYHSQNDRKHADTTNDILSVEPRDTIIFQNLHEEVIGHVIVTNKTDKKVAFKVRTTGPEKFWVRPSSGIIEPKKFERISVTILPGYEKTAMRDRFLIMAIPFDAKDKTKIAQSDIAEIWRITSKVDVEEHRLKCYYHVRADSKFLNTNSDVKETANTTNSGLEELRKEVNALKLQVADASKKIELLQMYWNFVIVLLIVLFVIVYKSK